jgi:hypothetical protein
MTMVIRTGTRKVFLSLAESDTFSCLIPFPQSLRLPFDGYHSILAGENFYEHLSLYKMNDIDLAETVLTASMMITTEAIEADNKARDKAIRPWTLMELMSPAGPQ